MRLDVEDELVALERLTGRGRVQRHGFLEREEAAREAAVGSQQQNLDLLHLALRH